MDKKVIVNCATGVVSEVELTAEEIAEREAAAVQAEAERVAAEEAAQVKTTQRVALLERLGITEDEAKLLLS